MSKNITFAKFRSDKMTDKSKKEMKEMFLERMPKSLQKDFIKVWDAKIKKEKI